jgi:hypothetical protein
MIIRHLAFWLDALNTVLPRRQPRIEPSVFSSPVLAERLAGTVGPVLRDRAEFLVHRPDSSHGRGYYSGFALRIAADHGGTELGRRRADYDAVERHPRVVRRRLKFALPPPEPHRCRSVSWSSRASLLAPVPEPS